MLVDLVRTTTEDGVTLEGVLQRPAAPGALALDAVLMVHGTGSNFFGSALMEIMAERCASLGVAALRVNTRGHDHISIAATTRGGLRLGAAFETVDDCRRDLAAWTGWLHANVGPRVLWLGHSLGAVKCVYAATHGVGQASVGVVAISPPRLSHSWFRRHKPEFVADFEKAESRIGVDEIGLIEVRVPMPMFISPAGYIEKYGTDERYNFLRFVRGLHLPTLFTWGGQEMATNVAFAELADEMKPWCEKMAHLQVRTVADADHVYTGKRDVLADLVEAWIRAGFPPQ